MLEFQTLTRLTVIGLSGYYRYVFELKLYMVTRPHVGTLIITWYQSAHVIYIRIHCTIYSLKL